MLWSCKPACGIYRHMQRLTRRPQSRCVISFISVSLTSSILHAITESSRALLVIRLMQALSVDISRRNSRPIPLMVPAENSATAQAASVRAKVVDLPAAGSKVSRHQRRRPFSRFPALRGWPVFDHAAIAPSPTLHRQIVPRPADGCQTLRPDEIRFCVRPRSSLTP